MFKILFLFSLVFSLGKGGAETGCGSILAKLHSGSTEPRPVNLKKAQEIAEDYVNRKIASEVLTDPGVELAFEHAVEMDQLGTLPFGVKQQQEELISEAIEEALLARGMSPGQAQKAAKGWTKAMLKEGILPK